jgi:hypothetical protein
LRLHREGCSRPVLGVHADELDRAMARKAKAIKADRVQCVRRPVSGHPMRLPAGRTLADVTPFANDPKAQAQARRPGMGRLGAAQIAVGLDRDG